MSQYESSKALSADPMYRWSAAVRRTDSNGTSYASAVLIAPDLFITAGHVTPRNDSLTAKLHELVFGPNYHTSNDRHPIARTERYPGYVFGNSSTTDLGVGWTTSFVPDFGNNPLMLSSSVTSGTKLTVAEYGNFGDATTGELPSLGDRLAGNGLVGTTNGIYPNSMYFSTFFDGSGAADSLNVGMLNYSSGSGWYSSTGLAGITTASSNRILIGGQNIILNLSGLKTRNPDLYNYLQPLIFDSWSRYYSSLSALPTLTCSATITAAHLVFSNLIPAREYRVMRSPTLSGWEEAHRFSAAAGPGSWGEALAPGGKMFYRLEWNE